MKKEKEIDLSKRVSLTLEEASEVFGVPAETLRKWTDRGDRGLPPLKSYKPGKVIMVFIEDLRNYIKMFPREPAA